MSLKHWTSPWGDPKVLSRAATLVTMRNACWKEGRNEGRYPDCGRDLTPKPSRRRRSAERERERATHVYIKYYIYTHALISVHM